MSGVDVRFMIGKGGWLCFDVCIVCLMYVCIVCMCVCMHRLPVVGRPKGVGWLAWTRAMVVPYSRQAGFCHIGPPGLLQSSSRSYDENP